MTQVAWFELPVTDVARAAEFYGSVLNQPLGEIDGPDGKMTVFMGEQGPVGALTTEDTTVAYAGVLIYLAIDDIATALGRAKSAGGTVLQERTSIGPFGFVGKFKDSEGNTVALHSD
jgi:predicted enzyme related to lactoylglutathione lyase